MRRLDTIEQHKILESYNIFPFKLRLLYRISIFSFKILNREILSKFQNGLNIFVDKTISLRLKLINSSKAKEKIDIFRFENDFSAKNFSIKIPKNFAENFISMLPPYFFVLNNFVELVGGEA